MSTRNIISHLYAIYVNISPSDIQENETHFRAPYNTNHPIKTLIYQVETSVEYAIAVNTPSLPAQVNATAYQIVFQTGIFNDNCKVWKCKADAYKTWENFKVDFSSAYPE